jgi:hypothetical protein
MLVHRISFADKRFLSLDLTGIILTDIISLVRAKPTSDSQKKRPRGSRSSAAKDIDSTAAEAVKDGDAATVSHGTVEAIGLDEFGPTEDVDGSNSLTADEEISHIVTADAHALLSLRPEVKSAAKGRSGGLTACILIDLC